MEKDYNEKMAGNLISELHNLKMRGLIKESTFDKYKIWIKQDEIMSKKQATAPAECLKMNIELADNGIIIRNPENEDEVFLAMESYRPTSDGPSTDHSDEYKLIGMKVYHWLFDEVLEKHSDKLIITNFDIDVVAVAKGREF